MSFVSVSSKQISIDMCVSQHFTFWSIVAITLARPLDYGDLQERIKEKLDDNIWNSEIKKKQIKGFDVKPIIVINANAGFLSVANGAGQVQEIVPVFIQFTGQGKDHIQIPSTISMTYILSMTVGTYLSMP